MKCKSYDSFFETFSNKTRIGIIGALTQGPKSVTEICKMTNGEQSQVSHSLKKLMECHFLDVEREGKKRIYSLNKDTIIPVLKLVEVHVNKYCNKECGKQ